MGRGQMRSRAITASRKAGAAKRSMKSAVRRAQKKLEAEAGIKQKIQERRDKITRQDFEQRQAFQRQKADNPGDDFQFNKGVRRGRRNLEGDRAWGRDIRDRRRVDEPESLLRRDDRAPRYRPDGRPARMNIPREVNRSSTNAPRNRFRDKDINSQRRGDGDVAERRDRNSREVGGNRMMDYIDRRRAELRRNRRNERRRERYRERKELGPNAPRARTRKTPGFNQEQINRMLINFYPSWEVYYWRLK